MAIYHIVGNNFITDKKLRDMDESSIGMDWEIEESKNRAPKAQPIPSQILPGSKEITEFEPLSIGGPLCVMIRHVYTGKYGGFKRDMLITSAMKSIATYDAMPRAVNFLVKNIEKKDALNNPYATEEGTPIVFYTPALVEENTIITLEVILRTIDLGIFEGISNVLKNLGVIPIFAGQTAGLLTASIATGLIGKILKLIFDGKPILKVNEALTFNIGGAKKPSAGFKLITTKEFKKNVLKEYDYSETGELVYMDNPEKKYDGDEPYMVISLDGRVYSEYEDFIPKAAGSVLLDKFYNIQGKKEPLNILTEVAELYNDKLFTDKADSTLSLIDDWNRRPKEYKNSEKGKKEKKKLKDIYNACVTNIQNEDIQKMVEKRGP